MLKLNPWFSWPNDVIIVMVTLTSLILKWSEFRHWPHIQNHGLNLNQLETAVMISFNPNTNSSLKFGGHLHIIIQYIKNYKLCINMYSCILWVKQIHGSLTLLLSGIDEANGVDNASLLGVMVHYLHGVLDYYHQHVHLLPGEVNSKWSGFGQQRRKPGVLLVFHVRSEPGVLLFHDQHFHSERSVLSKSVKGQTFEQCQRLVLSKSVKDQSCGNLSNVSPLTFCEMLFLWTSVKRNSCGNLM